jgi:hypothetical protein
MYAIPRREAYMSELEQPRVQPRWYQRLGMAFAPGLAPVIAPGVYKQAGRRADLAAAADVEAGVHEQQIPAASQAAYRGVLSRGQTLEDEASRRGHVIQAGQQVTGVLRDVPGAYVAEPGAIIPPEGYHEQPMTTVQPSGDIGEVRLVLPTAEQQYATENPPAVVSPFGSAIINRALGTEIPVGTEITAAEMQALRPLSSALSAGVSGQHGETRQAMADMTDERIQAMRDANANYRAQLVAQIRAQGFTSENWQELVKQKRAAASDLATLESSKAWAIRPEAVNLELDRLRTFITEVDALLQAMPPPTVRAPIMTPAPASPQQSINPGADQLP